MRVFRRRSSLGFLVLLAFAMQAVLAFAGRTRTHIPKRSRAQLATRAITYGACAVRAQHPCPPSAPHDDRGNCPICWSVNLATAAILQSAAGRPRRRPRALLRRSRCALSLPSAATRAFTSRRALRPFS